MAGLPPRRTAPHPGRSAPRAPGALPSPADRSGRCSTRSAPTPGPRSPGERPLDTSDVLQVRSGLAEAIPPLQRFEQALHPWVVFGVMPLFALANSGRLAGRDVRRVAGGSGLPRHRPGAVRGQADRHLRLHPGDSGGWASPPSRAARGWGKVYGVSVVAGIGFTVALFIANLAFAGAPHLLNQARLGVLVGSLVSGVVGHPRPPGHATSGHRHRHRLTSTTPAHSPGERPERGARSASPSRGLSPRTRGPGGRQGPCPFTGLRHASAPEMIASESSSPPFRSAPRFVCLPRPAPPRRLHSRRPDDEPNRRAGGAEEGPPRAHPAPAAQPVAARGADRRPRRRHASSSARTPTR